MFGRGRSRREGHPAAVKRRRSALVLVSLLAVLLQAFVVETHIHGAVVPASLGVEHQPAGAHPTDEHASATRAHQVVCSICQTLASSGAATLASASVLVAPQRDVVAARVALEHAPRALSHFWQSRGPPARLQA